MHCQWSTLFESNVWHVLPVVHTELSATSPPNPWHSFVVSGTAVVAVPVVVFLRPGPGLANPGSTGAPGAGCAGIGAMVPPPGTVSLICICADAPADAPAITSIARQISVGRIGFFLFIGGQMIIGLLRSTGFDSDQKSQLTRTRI